MNRLLYVITLFLALALSSCNPFSIIDKLKGGDKEAADSTVVDSGPSMAEIIESEDTIDESSMVGHYFKCTGTNVLVRMGPGKHYSRQMNGYYPAHLQKGDVVKCIQDEENNYAYVKNCTGYGWDEGWVCCDYLVPAR